MDRNLQSDTGLSTNVGQAAGDLGLFALVLLGLYLFIPLLILIARYRRNTKHNLNTSDSRVRDGKRNAFGHAISIRQQLAAYVYIHTTTGFWLDVLQAILSIVSVIAFIVGTYRNIGQGTPAWELILEVVLATYFLFDFAFRFYLASNRLRFYFSFSSFVDFITISPVFVGLLIEQVIGGFAGGSQSVRRAVQVFRVFRAIRIVRIIRIAPSYSLQRQIFYLTVTVVSMILVAAGFYQVFESIAEEDLVPFHAALYYMTSVVVGRPVAPVDSVFNFVFLVLVVLISVTAIPIILAQLIKLWIESGDRTQYKGNLHRPHVLVCGDVSAARLRAFLSQVVHPSRDPASIPPVVVLSPSRLQGELRALLDEHRYGSQVKYIRGSPQSEADLHRAGSYACSTCVVLAHRAGDLDSETADREVVATCYAIKKYNPAIRLYAQLRRQRARQHLMCIPGWRNVDKTISIASLSMTLLGVGLLLPGLPSLLTNLIHQGTRPYNESWSGRWILRRAAKHAKRRFRRILHRTQLTHRRQGLMSMPMDDAGTSADQLAMCALPEYFSLSNINSGKQPTPQSQQYNDKEYLAMKSWSFDSTRRVAVNKHNSVGDYETSGEPLQLSLNELGRDELYNGVYSSESDDDNASRVSETEHLAYWHRRLQARRQSRARRNTSAININQLMEHKREDVEEYSEQNKAAAAFVVQQRSRNRKAKFRNATAATIGKLGDRIDLRTSSIVKRMLRTAKLYPAPGLPVPTRLRMSLPKQGLQEYREGFVQEMYEIPLTAGLVGRSFGACARWMFLRYSVLLLAAKVKVEHSEDASEVAARRLEAILETDFEQNPAQVRGEPTPMEPRLDPEQERFQHALIDSFAGFDAALAAAALAPRRRKGVPSFRAHPTGFQQQFGTAIDAQLARDGSLHPHATENEQTEIRLFPCDMVLSKSNVLSLFILAFNDDTVDAVEASSGSRWVAQKKTYFDAQAKSMARKKLSVTKDASHFSVSKDDTSKFGTRVSRSGSSMYKSRTSEGAQGSEQKLSSQDLMNGSTVRIRWTQNEVLEHAIGGTSRYFRSRGIPRAIAASIAQAEYDLKYPWPFGAEQTWRNCLRSDYLTHYERLRNHSLLSNIPRWCCDRQTRFIWTSRRRRITRIHELQHEDIQNAANDAKERYRNQKRNEMELKRLHSTCKTATESSAEHSQKQAQTSSARIAIASFAQGQLPPRQVHRLPSARVVRQDRRNSQTPTNNGDDVKQLRHEAIVAARQQENRQRERRLRQLDGRDISMYSHDTTGTSDVNQDTLLSEWPSFGTLHNATVASRSSMNTSTLSRNDHIDRNVSNRAGSAVFRPQSVQTHGQMNDQTTDDTYSDSTQHSNGSTQVADTSCTGTGSNELPGKSTTSSASSSMIRRVSNTQGDNCEESSLIKLLHVHFVSTKPLKPIDALVDRNKLSRKQESQSDVSSQHLDSTQRDATQKPKYAKTKESKTDQHGVSKQALRAQSPGFRVPQSSSRERMQPPRANLNATPQMPFNKNKHIVSSLKYKLDDDVQHDASPARSVATNYVDGLDDAVSIYSCVADAQKQHTYKDHILICGFSENIGLLLRAIRSVPWQSSNEYSGAHIFTPNDLHKHTSTIDTPAKESDVAGSDERLPPHPPQSDHHTSFGQNYVRHSVQQEGPRQHEIVVLCPNQVNPEEEDTLDRVHGRTTEWLHRIRWVQGTPFEAEDLVRAGALSARACIVLSAASSRKSYVTSGRSVSTNIGGIPMHTSSTAGGNENYSALLQDDIDAITISSLLYRLNPQLHVVTELMEGANAQYVSPNGYNLAQAAEYVDVYSQHLIEQVCLSHAKFQKAQAEIGRRAAQLLWLRRAARLSVERNLPVSRALGEVFAVEQQKSAQLGLTAETTSTESEHNSRQKIRMSDISPQVSGINRIPSISRHDNIYSTTSTSDSTHAYYNAVSSGTAPEHFFLGTPGRTATSDALNDDHVPYDTTQNEEADRVDRLNSQSHSRSVETHAWNDGSNSSGSPTSTLSPSTPSSSSSTNYASSPTTSQTSSSPISSSTSSSSDVTQAGTHAASTHTASGSSHPTATSSSATHVCDGQTDAPTGTIIVSGTASNTNHLDGGHEAAGQQSFTVNGDSPENNGKVDFDTLPHQAVDTQTIDRSISGDVHVASRLHDTSNSTFVASRSPHTHGNHQILQERPPTHSATPRRIPSRITTPGDHTSARIGSPSSVLASAHPAFRGPTPHFSALGTGESYQQGTSPFRFESSRMSYRSPHTSGRQQIRSIRDAAREAAYVAMEFNRPETIAENLVSSEIHARSERPRSIHRIPSHFQSAIATARGLTTPSSDVQSIQYPGNSPDEFAQQRQILGRERTLSQGSEGRRGDRGSIRMSPGPIFRTRSFSVPSSNVPADITRRSESSHQRASLPPKVPSTGLKPRPTSTMSGGLQRTFSLPPIPPCSHATSRVTQPSQIDGTSSTTAEGLNMQSDRQSRRLDDTIRRASSSHVGTMQQPTRVASNITHQKSTKTLEQKIEKKAHREHEKARFIKERAQSALHDVRKRFERMQQDTKSQVDLFGAASFACGRAFSATSLDALLSEQHFNQHSISLLKRLVRASRKQRLQLVSVRAALYHIRFNLSRSISVDEIAAQLKGEELPSTKDTNIPDLKNWKMPRNATYGELFEGLLRGYSLLAIGLYRRVTYYRHASELCQKRSRNDSRTVEEEEMSSDESNVEDDEFTTLKAERLLRSRLPDPLAAFQHSKELLDYVYTNPRPDTVLNHPNDLVYVLSAG